MNRRRLHFGAFATVILLAAGLALSPQLAQALDLSCLVASDSTDGAVVHAQDESDGTYLFLPGQADIENLTLLSDQGAVEAWSYLTGSYEDVSLGADLVDLGVAGQSGELPSGGGDAVGETWRYQRAQGHCHALLVNPQRLCQRRP